MVDLDRRVVVDRSRQGSHRHHRFGGGAVGAAARRSATAVGDGVRRLVRLGVALSELVAEAVACGVDDRAECRARR